MRAALYGLRPGSPASGRPHRSWPRLCGWWTSCWAILERGEAAEELIHQSETIFSRLASVSSLDAQKMIESIRRKTRWHYWAVTLVESTDGGPFGHWRVVRAGLAARDGAMASRAPCNILYYMQNEAMRLMIPARAAMAPSRRS